MPLDGARLFHVNVNCSNLERSSRFYTDGLGLTPGARTSPETAQPGAAFGLATARWDASILLGQKAYEGGAIDLLEWQEPAPVGAPPDAPTVTGFQRLGMRVPDLDAAIARAEALGGARWSPPFEHALENGGAIRLVIVSDPDGTAIELIEGGPAALSFVAVTCRDLERSRAVYGALGFRELARYPSENDDGAHLRLDGPVAMDEVVLAAPGGGDVLLMLVGFRTPAPVAAAERPANALGMWRAAFLVADLDAAYAAASAVMAPISEPVALAMGPGLPTLRFCCLRGPDAEVIELIEQPAPSPM